MITKETIIDFFEDLKINSDFNLNEELLWGYFFLDKDYNKLKKISEYLEKEEYRFVDIFEAEKETEDDPEEYYLHIEKVEFHNVDSLDKRNRYFYNLAVKNNIDSYDGFYVGNV